MTSNAPPLFDPILRRLERDSERYFGASARLQPLEYTHREFSDLLRIRVSLSSGSIDAFVKVLRPKGDTAADRDAMARRVCNSFEQTQELHEKLRTSTGVGAVRPIACFPQDLALITEQALGMTMVERIAGALRRGRPRSMTRELERAFERVGAWLRAYQASAPRTERFDLVAFREYVDVRLRRLVSNPRSGVSPELRKAILASCRLAASLVAPEDLPLVTVHADLSLGNLLIDDDRVTVLDFDMAALGCRYQDLAQVHLQLDLIKAKPWIRSSGLSRLQDALLRGYDVNLDATASLFRLMLLKHTVCHLERLVSQKEPAVARLFSARQQRRHLRWLQSFVMARGAR